MTTFDTTGEAGSARPGRRRDQPLDDVDRTLLLALRENARIAYADLARTVGLSAPSVTDRVRRMEQLGVIRGYRADWDLALLGLGVVALVSIEQSDSGDQDEIGAALVDLQEIEDCWFVAGQESYVVKVRVPDIDALEGLLGRLRRIAGVGRTHTTVVLSTKWEGRAELPTGDGQDEGADR
jgi:Lrp/AsnC family leucine-responsive transcriptional regulator